MHPKSLQLCLTVCDPMDCTYQAPLSLGFSRQEYWSRLPFPSPGDLPYPGIEPGSPALQTESLLSELPGKPLRTCCYCYYCSVLKSCPTLCNCMNCHMPGFPVLPYLLELA